MFQFWTQFIENYRRRKCVQELIRSGTLTPVQSFEQYSRMVKDAKAAAEHRLFTNCFLMQDEVERLISLKRFYRVETNNGIAFADDEISHYYMFFYVDLKKELGVPTLDRNILVENIYLEGRMTPQQESFDNMLKTAGFIQGSTYRQIGEVPQLDPKKYWKKYHVLKKTLEDEGKYICRPTNKQLKQFEKIYRNEIDTYVQKKFTRRERKKQRDQGLLWCVADRKGEVYAIRIAATLHGGAISGRSDLPASIYAPALLFDSCRTFYEDMPTDPEKQKEYMRCLSFGWIATTNTPSLRLHSALQMSTTGRAMNQFVLPGFAK